MPGPDGNDTCISKGYFKNNFSNLTLGTYVTSPDKSNSWTNGHEIGGYLGGKLAIGDRVSLNGGMEVGYVKAVLDGDFEPGAKKDNLVIGLGLEGKVALNKNIAVTASGAYKLQGHNIYARATYMDASDYIQDSPGYGHWNMPGDYVEHCGYYYEFQNEMQLYNSEAYEYNQFVDEHNEPVCAERWSFTLGLEATNDKNTITGGIKGIYKHSEGYGLEKVKNDKFSFEGYGSVNVWEGISINASVNPIDKVVKTGVSISIF